MDSDFLLREIQRSGINDAEIQISLLDETSDIFKVSPIKSNFIEKKNARIINVDCIYKKRKGSLYLLTDENINFQDIIKKVYNIARFFGSKDIQTNFYFSKLKLKQKCKIKNRNNFSETISLINNYLPKEGKVRASLERENQEFYCANDSGARVEYSNSTSYFENQFIYSDMNKKATGFDVIESKKFTSYDIENSFKKSKLMAKSMLNASKAPTTYGKLILDPLASINFLSSLIDTLNGEYVVNNTSFMSKYLNKEVASKLVNIREVKSINGSFYNRKFDDEMVPTTNKFFIKKGVLKNFINNIYSAEKLKQKPLGNSFNVTFGSLRPTNLVFNKGKTSIEDMIKEVDKGIYLVDTGDSPNISTGDISYSISIGYYIENGEIKYPVKESLIGSNILSMLKNISIISLETKFLYGIKAPALLIDNVKISGR